MAMERERLSAKVKAGLLAPYRNWHDRVAINAFVKDIPATPKHRTWAVLERLEQSLDRFAALPVMFVWGMRDWCFDPPCMHRLQMAMPHARSVEIPDAGHYVMEDATEEVLAAIAEFTQATSDSAQNAPA